MATPSTNIGLILIKKDAAAENIRVPPFILHALLRSVGDNLPANAVNLAIDNNASNGRIIAYIAADPFQLVLNSLRVAETARAAQHSAEVYMPAIYYNIGNNVGGITRVTYDGATNAITPSAVNLKTITFTKDDVNEYRKIWNTLPEGHTPAVAAAADDNFFATRIKLVTTVFSKIYEQLPTKLDKAAVNVLAITALNAAYDSTLLADITQDAVAAAAAAPANIGKAFIRFFKRVIIGQGMASQSFIVDTAANATASTSKADVELFTHYLNDTTEGASVLSNKVDITDETRKNIELFFTDYLKAKKEEFKGGYKIGGTRRRQRRRNRKSSKRRSQKKSSKRKKSKRGRKSKRIRRIIRSHRK
jgi:hypothetical protein